MEVCSHKKNYERAGYYRDLISSLRQVQSKLTIISQQGNVDVVAIARLETMTTAHWIYVRDGRVIGHKSFFVKLPIEQTDDEVLSSLLAQYYLHSRLAESMPSTVLVNVPLPEKAWLQSALSEQHGRKIIVQDSVRGKNKRWLMLAENNAKQALLTYTSKEQAGEYHLQALQREMQLPSLPERMECFDISHSMGEATVASCVVFEFGRPANQLYRRFNIKGAGQSDDYAALYEAISRRYKRLKMGEAPLPDLLLIDGGKGQLKQAIKVLEELQITDVMVLSIAKGAGRKPGMEKLFVAGRDGAVQLAADSPALHVLQHIRDEAHRFAITGHRKARAKKRAESPLEGIPGVGPKRRRELLRQFGGLQALAKANIEEIAQVPGVSAALAKAIFDALHD